MNEINKLQNIIFYISDEVKKICEKNEIQYSLDGGSLLGAIRHKGFIPWDDDFDLAMKREEYNKFIKVCSTELNNNIFLLETSDNTEKHPFEFAKVHLKNTEIIEDFSQKVDVNHGIFIDIFPYYNLPDNVLSKIVYLFLNHLLKNMIWVKCGYGTESYKNKMRYKIIKVISNPFSIKVLKKLRKKILNHYNNKRTQECFTADYPHTKLKNVWFEEYTNYLFENTYFQGFKDAQKYLTKLYGDFMTLPPVNKRIIHSKYPVNFGPYE